MTFFYVYVLQSLVKDWTYVGYSQDLRKRYEEHNNGESPSTSPYKPFTLIFYEAYRNEKDAKRREKYLKTTKGKTTLRSMLHDYLTQGHSS